MSRVTHKERVLIEYYKKAIIKIIIITIIIIIIIITIIIIIEHCDFEIEKEQAGFRE